MTINFQFNSSEGQKLSHNYHDVINCGFDKCVILAQFDLRVGEKMIEEVGSILFIMLIYEKC